jgi:hypothetical protein
VACASAIELRLDSDITTAPLERPSLPFRLRRGRDDYGRSSASCSPHLVLMKNC